MTVIALVLALAAPLTPGGLAVAGDLPRTGILTVADLARLAPESIDLKGPAGKQQARGVRLDKILVHFGFSAGDMGKRESLRDKRAGWKKVVRATAADGFEAAFSCAELSDQMGPTRAYVIFEVDGKPLPPEVGPLRLTVPTDKEPSRSLRQLARVEVIDLRAPVGR
jgi:hypothetical protein